MGQVFAGGVGVSKLNKTTVNIGKSKKAVGDQVERVGVEAGHCQTQQYNPGLLMDNIKGIMPLWRE